MRTIGTDRSGDDFKKADRFVNIAFQRKDGSLLRFKDPNSRASVSIKLCLDNPEHAKIIALLDADEAAVERFADKLVLDYRSAEPDTSGADQVDF